MKIPAHRFEPFTQVYLRANGDMSGLITGLVLRTGCPVQYLVTWGNDGEEKSHWEPELTTERPLDLPGDGVGAE